MNQDHDKLNILITYRWQELDEGLLQRIRDVSPRLNVIYSKDEAQDEQLLPVTDILYCIQLPKSIKSARRLKWIQLLSGGYNVLHGSPVEATDIAVTTSSGIHGTPIAEFVMSLMVILSRRLHEAVRVKDPKDLWGDFAFLGRELRDLTVGIIGVGAIGREIARLARCFGMGVHGVDIRQNAETFPDDRYLPDELRASSLSDDDQGLEIRSPDDLDWLLKSTDFVVLTLPLTPKTENLIGEKQLRMMKPSAFLINPARGALVNEAALLNALKENWIAGAALDAFHIEPLPPDSPFYSMPNVFITPHMAAHTDRLFDRCIDVFCENLRRYLDGRPLLNQVHPPDRSF